MTETIAEYTAGGATKVVENNLASCPECGMVFGYELKGGKYLRVGRVNVTWMAAECDCGKMIYWGASDRLMKRITRNR